MVVIAVLGVLAAVVIVSINPLQQLAKTRDAGRLDSVTQMGDALLTYAESHSNTFPTVAQWTASPNQLVAAGELTAIPSAVAYSGGTSACTTNVINSTWCYQVTAGTGAIVYAKTEALSNSSNCGTGTSAYYVYSTSLGRAGGVCAATEAAIGLSPTFTF